MKLNNQQAQMLLQILMDSLKMNSGYSYSHNMRSELYESIITQQSTEPKELQDE